MNHYDLRARCFGPGLPPAGGAQTVQIQHGGLHFLDAQGRPRTRPLSQLQLQAAGFNDGHWQFRWDEPEGAWAIIIEDPAAQARIAAAPPPELVSLIQGAQGRQRRTRRLFSAGIAGAGVWMLAPLLLLIALIFAAKPLIGWGIGHISVAQEEKLGAWFWKGQKAGLRLIDDTDANLAIQAIGERLTEGSAYRFRWFIADDPAINAFAMPGGIVVVNTGLIEAADSAEELAGVLAHEVQHVELRHSLSQLAQQAGLRLVVTLVVGDLGGAGEIAARLTQLKFSRDAETEADLEGLAALRRAGIDPQGMVAMFRKLDTETGPAPPQILSTHPVTEQRVEALLQAMQGSAVGTVQPLPIDWNEVRHSLNKAG